ncbi:macrophage colony-stimulating factor 1 receptor [Pelobates fuscus]|uniref:macrophage colony-stimulating factor 1 receptor n=1 Tax=Pelobates fuscus TaxID=191477 RepID=UPI002FE434E0
MGITVLTLLITITIRHALASPVIEPVGEELIIKKGESITLNCSGTQTVTWKMPSSSKKIKVTNNDTMSMLEITGATNLQTGTYECFYSTNVSEKASVHLFVTGSQLWHNLEDRIYVDEDTEAILPCLITDPTIPISAISLKMLSNNNVIPIPATMNATFNPHKGFTIYNVQIEFDNIYICQARGKHSDEITLSVKEVPKVVPSLELDSYLHIQIEGEPLTITCKVSSSVEPQVKWQYNAENVLVTYHFTYNKHTWTKISVLHIPEVKMTDSGIYKCTGTNKAGSSTTFTTLKVVERGYVKLSASQNNSIVLKVAQNVKMKVEIEAYPTDLYWQWIHVNGDNLANVTALGKIQSLGPYSYVNILTLNRLQINESGTYTLSVYNSKANALFSFEVILLCPPKVAISSSYSGDGTIVLNCTAWGNPLPSIAWMCANQNCTFDPEQRIASPETRIFDTRVESVLFIHESQLNSSIGCNASNSEGTDSQTTVLTARVTTTMHMVENSLFNPLLTAITVFGVFLFILTVFLYYKYQQKPKYEVRWQIVRVSEGNNYTCIDPTQLPYNERWEFPRNNLHFGKTLGAGAFGKVMEATAFGMGKDDSALRVAVKMLKPSAHRDEVEALMSELKILSHLGNHQNIVNLLGACTHGGPILVITEYCQHGDLLNFLRRKAESMNRMFAALHTNSDYKNMSMEKKYMGSDKDSYLEMKPASNNNVVQGTTDTEEDDTDDHLPLDLHDLLNFSLQVAQGMAFLAEKNCIHRDVAARNVLVTDGRTAKICDFGLARDIENDSNYVVKGNARLPVKWMAPESIFDCIYTVQSDVWSYGILLWEIFSLGRSPYPGILVNQKFYKMVKDGYKMDCPDYAPLEIYRIMKTCWDLEPTRRPTFNQISDLINMQMGNIKEQDYTNITQMHEENECLDIKCEANEPFIKGNNYQFC